jgi:hypothetical protein
MATTEEIADRLARDLCVSMREAYKRVPSLMLEGPDSEEGFDNLVLYFVLEASKRGISIVAKGAHDIETRAKQKVCRKCGRVEYYHIPQSYCPVFEPQ